MTPVASPVKDALASKIPVGVQRIAQRKACGMATLRDAVRERLERVIERRKPPFGFGSSQDARGLATAALTTGTAFAKRLVEKTATPSPQRTCSPMPS
ncbi:hypothetical protein [Nostoc sp.]|uniref:hypothetical protein n=1 Tax=Nostoc sp. TaxID=1180 RepID=UPI002FFC43D3